MRWVSSVKTDVGLVRPSNEDAFFADDECGVFVVADGMGGHAAGEIASRMAAETVGTRLAGLRKAGAGTTEVREGLMDAIDRANLDILERAVREPDKRGMGTTLTVLTLMPEGGYLVAQVGDSRAYRLRDGKMEQLTRDHTVVQEQVEQGVISSDQARKHPLSHILTRALGTRADVEPDVYTGDAQPGDVFLLASDGLCGPVSDEEIAEIILGSLKAPAKALESLIRAAKKKGGHDNVTAVLVKIGKP